jgi:hypothetical protein
MKVNGAGRVRNNKRTVQLSPSRADPLAFRGSDATRLGQSVRFVGTG